MGKKRALLSAYDKTGLLEFAKGLESLGYEIVSTGGTGSFLKEAGLAVTDISDVTGFPECLDGRVKTLHPLIHAGILAMRGNESHMKQLAEIGAVAVDVVVNNLYPFKATILKEGVTLEEAIENIDIGGPSMLRAAAKNWQDVVVLVDPSDYPEALAALQTGGLSREKKFALACKVFSHTAAYDAMITNYLNAQLPGGQLLPENLTLTYEKAQGMRYGENPHQDAAFYREPIRRGNGLADAKQLHGKELSYNNINDANGALDMLKDLDPDKANAVAVKHANPCGVGFGDTVLEAYLNAFAADPVSIYGGILALNRTVDLATVQAISKEKVFLEIIIAPSYDADAFEALKKKKNLRILELPGIQLSNSPDTLDMKKVTGGLLVQQYNTELFGGGAYETVTKRAPTEKEMEQLKFAWRVVKHVKSNGICLAKDKRTVGVGPGQTNRITAAELAIKYAGENAKDSVMASDAYLPFPDCVEAAAKAGVTAIIQPGGSIRDEDSIRACDEAGIAMVFTGIRHFKH